MKHMVIEDVQPLVSIVIPVYNAEKFLYQTLDCATRQSISNIEVIVVNDGSTDGSQRIIDMFMCFRNFKQIKKENGGTGSALNEGHKVARGKYVTWWSSDNIYVPSFCETFLKAFGEIESSGQDVGLVYSDFCYINEQGQKIRDIIHQNPQSRRDLIEGHDVGISFMYTKGLWDKTGLYWDRICEDYEWICRAAQYTAFGLINAVLAGFRVHGGQITGSNQEEERAAADHCRALAKELFGDKTAA
jgi:glycosyltransferase involved in cell wall biosynthesis